MLFDATGAFNPVALGNPTDVAGLLWRKRDEYLREKSAEIGRRRICLVDQKIILERLKDSIDIAIKNYLTSINYANDYKARLVFPDVKVEFKPNKWNKYVIDEVRINP